MVMASSCCASPFMGVGATAAADDPTLAAQDSPADSSNQSSATGSPGQKKRRRRAENEMLMQDLLSIDRSLAAAVTEESSPGTGGSDSPAQHLRPRRNIRPPSSAALYAATCSLSPLLLGDGGSMSPSLGRWVKEHSVSIKIEPQAPPPTQTPQPPTTPADDGQARKQQRLDRCVLRDVDGSVFAPLLPPGRLDSNSLYQYNYVALRVTEVKPLRFVHLVAPTTQSRCRVPVLELLAADCHDRHQVDYMRDIFDDSTSSSSNSSSLSVFLLGSYALQSDTVACKDAVVNIVSFRTSAPLVTRNLKKRKLLPAAQGKPSTFSIIVDSPHDRWEQQTDDGGADCGGSQDPFEQMYEESGPCDAQRFDWLPLVSYCQRWKPPTDPRELNRSLYIIQPCIAKFESSSRTVKMSSLSGQ